MEKFFETILGPNGPATETYRSKLCSSTKGVQVLDSSPMRQTPRFLRVIATPDDNQNDRLEGHSKGDMAILRWSFVNEYVGSSLDAITLPMSAIP